LTESELAREWTAFGGASLALMGQALLAGARSLAKEHADWQEEWSRAVGRTPLARAGNEDFLARVYAAAGAMGLLLGVLILAAAAGGRTLSAGPANARALGAVLAALGLAAALHKAGRALRRAPLFLQADPLAAPPEPSLGESVSGAAVWLLCGLWAAFGLRLFSGAPR
jgi:hypothetical protein